jgi:hypothetical protein
VLLVVGLLVVLLLGSQQRLDGGLLASHLRTQLADLVCVVLSFAASHVAEHVFDLHAFRQGVVVQ